MTTPPVVECEHPGDQRAWLSEICEAGYIEPFFVEGTGLCGACKDWESFSLVCECGATVEATGEAA